MFRLRQAFSLTLVLAMASMLVLPSYAFAAPLPAPGTPTLLNPTEGFRTTEVKPLIKGLTQNNTQVAVYIDEVYNGQAQVKNGSQGTASFAYYPFLNLAPGWHTVKVKAQDSRTGLESKTTLVQSFYVDLPLPAPTLSTPVVNSKTTWAKPWIVGLSKNNTTIQVYIDGVYNGKTEVANDPSGVGNFAYQPFLDLALGAHQVSVVAQDNYGKSSASSSPQKFIVVAPLVPDQNPDRASLEQNSGSQNKNENFAPESAPQESADSTSKDSNVGAAPTSSQAQTSTFGWVLLALVAAGLVYRNRQSVKGFFKDQNPSGLPIDSKSEIPVSTVEVITKSSQNKTDPNKK